MILIYLLKLREGQSVDAGLAYLNRADPLLERNGIVKLGYHAVQSRIRGVEGLEPDIVQIARIDGPESFDSLARDADYTLLVPLRDTIFDLDNCDCWLVDEST